MGRPVITFWEFRNGLGDCSGAQESRTSRQRGHDYADLVLTSGWCPKAILI